MSKEENKMTRILKVKGVIRHIYKDGDKRGLTVGNNDDIEAMIAITEFEEKRRGTFCRHPNKKIRRGDAKDKTNQKE